MITLSKLEVRLFALIAKHEPVKRTYLVDRQLERCVEKRRLETADGYRIRKARARDKALDRLVELNLISRGRLFNFNPGKPALYYNITTEGKAFLKKHGAGTGVFISE